MMTAVDWPHWRAQMCLDPDSIYFNAGSYSPVPIPVLEALAELRRQFSLQPSDFLWRQMPPVLNEARRRLAEYLDAQSDNLLLQLNVTHAVNLAARSLRLRAGDEILMTNQEYGAMQYCWEQIAKEQDLTIRRVEVPWTPQSPDELVDVIRGAMTDRTAVLFFSHVTSPTGLILPAEKLCAVARERGVLTVVDGAHAPGMLPVRLDKINADFYGANCHKWMMAPTGAGFLYLRPEHRELLKPLIVSWGWKVPPGAEERACYLGGSHWTANFEYQGTLDRRSQMVLPELLDFRARIGESAMHRRVDELVAYLRRQMESIGYEAVTPASRELSGSLTAFALPKVDVWKSNNWMWNTHRIEAPASEVGDRCFLRVSTGWYNTEAEIGRLVEVMREYPWRE